MTKRKSRSKNKLIRKIKFRTNKIKETKLKRKVKENPVKKDRKEKIKRRKNFFASLLLTILLWLLLFLFVYLTDPEHFTARLVFFVFLFVVTLFTTSFVFANTRRGLITATTVVVFLVLRYYGVGNILNLILLVGLAVSIEYYLSP